MQRQLDGFVRCLARNTLGNCHDKLVVEHERYASTVCAVCATMSHLPVPMPGKPLAKIIIAVKDHDNNISHSLQFSASTLQLDRSGHATLTCQMSSRLAKELVSELCQADRRLPSRALSARHPGTISTVECSLDKDFAPVSTGVWPKQTVDSTLAHGDLHSRTSPQQDIANMALR